MSEKSIKGGFVFTTKNTSFLPILRSQNDIHFTCYIANRGSLLSVQTEILQAIARAEQCLRPVLGAEDLKRFLSPIFALAKDESFLTRINGNLAIFRTFHSFRILNFPIEVESLAIVATSFHVKPLLRWLQIDQDFLLLGIEEHTVTLYQGSQKSFQYVDSLMIEPEASFYLSPVPLDNIRKSKLDTVLAWISERLGPIEKGGNPKLFIAGSKPLADAVLRKLTYTNLHPRSLGPAFRPENAFHFCRQARAMLFEAARSHLKASLLEFEEAQKNRLGKRNLFEVAKAVLKGNVKKLIVADGCRIFGKIDRTTGGLEIHPYHQDHEDDDILDDLAQEVLNRGGQVVVVSGEEVPKESPVLAILKKTQNG